MAFFSLFSPLFASHLFSWCFIVVLVAVLTVGDSYNARACLARLLELNIFELHYFKASGTIFFFCSYSICQQPVCIIQTTNAVYTGQPDIHRCQSINKHLLTLYNECHVGLGQAHWGWLIFGVCHLLHRWESKVDSKWNESTCIQRLTLASQPH